MGSLPSGSERLHAIHRYCVHKRCDAEVVNARFNSYVSHFDLDAPIWSNEIQRETPLLAEPEKDFGRFRRWYRQSSSTVEPNEAMRSG